MTLLTYYYFFFACLLACQNIETSYKRLFILSLFVLTWSIWNVLLFSENNLLQGMQNDSGSCGKRINDILLHAGSGYFQIYCYRPETESTTTFISPAISISELALIWVLPWHYIIHTHFVRSFEIVSIQ